MLRNISDYQLKNLINEATRNAEEAEALAAAYRNIKRLYKKDGSDFSIMSKNFEGCNFREPRYTKSYTYEKEICVCVQTISGRYVSDYVKNYENVKYSDIKPDPARVIHEPCREPYFYYTAAELMDLFQKTAAQHEKNAEKYRDTIARTADIVKYFNGKMEEIEKELARINSPISLYTLLNLA